MDKFSNMFVDGVMVYDGELKPLSQTDEYRRKKYSDIERKYFNMTSVIEKNYVKMKSFMFY
ncbi:hypothetical protein PSI15_05530 [Xenorhabdus sp. PR6a]|uniref:hypothetical protein n=1 Tax=Xenorhabdus sp. PR6a TaxID=3025877 RepID=UPI002358F93E|nr:hypothetical protein [Xenorhabdus sp. PR6a]MDC9581038.1 hypothetical protein [Xenorhabdus sp. PR6a]